MGWDYHDSSQSKGTHKTAGDYLASLHTFTRKDGMRGSVVAHEMVGDVWYAAIRIEGETEPSCRACYATPDNFVAAVVHLTEGRWGAFGRWGHKGIDELMGPAESRAPAAVLRVLTDLTDHAYAREARDWRARCRHGLDARLGAVA